MNYADFVIIAIVVISAIIGVVRGFVREAISLGFLIIAFWLGYTYSEQLGELLNGHVANPNIRLVVGFFAIFVIVLIIGSFISFLLVKLVHKTGLSGTDRLIGFIFGLLRGILLIALLLLLAKATGFDNTSWYKNSMLIPYFKDLVSWLQSLLPTSIEQHFAQIKAAAKKATAVKGSAGSAGSAASSSAATPTPPAPTTPQPDTIPINP